MLELTIDNTGSTFKTHQLPDTCPICHRYIVAYGTYANSPKDEEKTVEVIFKCNNPACEHLFISTYLIREKYAKETATPNPEKQAEVLMADIAQLGSEFLKYIAPYDLIKSEPIRPKKLIVNKSINTMSPMFYTIYQESLEAESRNLNEIAGGGFRKALEFLIKDYCINHNPQSEDDIKNKPLMQVVNTYMKEASKVKSMSTKAVWLGNDEVHYVRKWEDKDIRHLKILIDLTLHWVESELLTEEFEQDMVR